MLWLRHRIRPAHAGSAHRAEEHGIATLAESHGLVADSLSFNLDSCLPYQGPSHLYLMIEAIADCLQNSHRLRGNLWSNAVSRQHGNMIATHIHLLLA